MRLAQLRSESRVELIWGSGVALLGFLVYVSTLCPTLNFIDSGELSAVAYTLGIAHPTGYPLFTLLGWCFAHLPLGLGVIYQMNLMSAVLCSGALFLLFRFFTLLLGEVHPAPRGSVEIYLPSAFGTLFLGFSATYWSQALAVEVYSLHLLLVSAILLLFATAIFPALRKNRRSVEGSGETLLLAAFAFVLGLSFANHMTTIFLAPAFLYLFFSAYRFTGEAWRRLALMSVPFLAGLSLYIYLPLRAAEHPALNWGNPVAWDSFLRHTSAKQYSVWLFSSAETARRQLGHFFSACPEEFVYVGMLLALAGAWSLFRQSRSIFLFTLLLFLGCVLYAINYDIHDIDSYFLLAYLTVALWSAIGLRALGSRMRHPSRRWIMAGAGIACLLGEGAINGPKVTLRDMYLVQGYTRDMFRSLAPDAVVLTYQWDYFVSASYYAQQVEGTRPDVTVIDKELLRRSWYFRQLEIQHPWLISQSRAEVDAFMVELMKFENNIPYNPQLIEYRFAALIRSFIEKNLASRPVYVTPEIEPQYTAGYRRLPSGLAERLLRELPDRGAPLPTPDFEIRIPERRDSYVEGLLGFYVRAYLRSAEQANALGEKAQARELIERALTLQPAMPEALRLKELVSGGT